MYKTRLLTAFLIFIAGAGLTIADDSAADAEKRDTAFREMLSNTRMTGSFTVDGKSDAPPKPETYTIKSVTKTSGNLWTFLTHIKYGKTDVTLPITVPVVWADGTPMVSLTDQSFPGLGDHFSARVLFYDGRYAGTWQHGSVGGHMFGRYEKNKTDAKTDAKTETKVEN